MQIPYTTADYRLYEEWTQRHDIRRIGFANALYRVKTGGHIQAVVSGEYNHGKSTTALLLTKWDTIYTRELLKHYEDPRYEEAVKHLKFSITNSVIISPKDPNSRRITTPQLLRPYEVDEGYLFTTSQEAAEKKTTRLRDRIAQNRKLAPSMYWVYPNIFKMPSIMLENMLEVIHKTSVGHGIMLAPSTVIQLKEKFDKQRIERYAKNPRYFSRAMRWHSAFVFWPHFPRMRGQAWNKYLAKYERYKMTEEEQTKKTESTKHKFFKKLDVLIERNIIRVESKDDVEKYIGMVLERESPGKHISASLPRLLASEYGDWKLERSSETLLRSLEDINLQSLKLEKDDVEAISPQVYGQ